MKLLLVDDHAVFLKSLKVLLTAKGYEVIGTAGNGAEAIRQARRLEPNLILMDIDMPVCDGLEAIRLIKTEMPQVKIVMLTVSASDEHLFEAIKSGASGYMLKSQSADQLLEMVAQVEAGGAALTPSMATRILEEFARQARRIERPEVEILPELTERQIQILTQVARGLTYQEIGRALHLSESTIRYHLGQILERLHLENRAQMIAYAAKRGWVADGPVDHHH